jgi:hypothetical protein
MVNPTHTAGATSLPSSLTHAHIEPDQAVMAMLRLWYFHWIGTVFMPMEDGSGEGRWDRAPWPKDILTIVRYSCNSFLTVSAAQSSFKGKGKRERQDCNKRLGAVRVLLCEGCESYR